MSVKILQGNCLDVLPTLDAASAHCCVTSPPYWGLRDYGVDSQIGMEPTPEEYVVNMVAVFREVKRVLRDDGTLWLNLGDVYFAGNWSDKSDARRDRFSKLQQHNTASCVHGAPHRQGPIAGLKPKDLVGIPWRVAFALQADGWYLRSDIIWAKSISGETRTGRTMPESTQDRPTAAHEHIFLLAKSKSYYYDNDAILEPATADNLHDATFPNDTRTPPGQTPRSGNRARKYGEASDRPESHLGRSIPWEGYTRTMRNVWHLNPQMYKGAHFATFPLSLIRPCILAGCPAQGTVLDPFGGSGTTGEVAEMEGRNSILIELNPEYIELAKKRTAQMGLFSA